jgi:hypothetical protein
MRHVFLLLALAAAPAPATPPAPASASAPAAEEVRIPFPRFGVRSFRTVGDDVVYLQDRRRDWYRAELAGSCVGLPMALRIGVDSRFGDVLERGSTLIVDGDRCTVSSLVRSAAPPPRPRR